MSGAGDATVRAWDVATQNQHWYRTLNEDVSVPVSVDFAPNGQEVAVLSRDGRVYVLDIKTGNERRRTDEIAGQLTQVRWSPDGKWIAAGGGSYTISLFEAATCELSKKFVGYDGGMNADWRFVFSPDGKTIAAPARYNGTDRGRDNPFPGGNAARRKPGPDDYDPELGPPNEIDGKTYVTLWDVESGKRTRTVGPGDDWAPSALGFSEDGTALVLRRGSADVFLYEFISGKEIVNFPADSGDIGGFRHDRLIVGGTAHDPATGKRLFELPVTPRVQAISADGTRLVTAEMDDCTPLVWSLRK